MIRRFPMLVAAVAGLVVLAGAIGGGMVFAASDQTPPAPTQNGGDKQQRLEDYLNRLAQNLGKSSDQLKAALKKTAIDEINQAVTDGKLNSDQAKKLIDAINNGTTIPLGPNNFGGKMPGGRGPNGPMPNGQAPNGQSPNGQTPNGQNRPGGGPGEFMGVISGAMNDVATALGISADQLKSDLQSGKSISDIANGDAGKLAGVKTALTNAAKSQFDAMVKSGKISQAQADKMLKAFNDNLNTMLKAKMPMFGPRGGHGPNGQNTPPRPGSSGTS